MPSINKKYYHHSPRNLLNSPPEQAHSLSTALFNINSTDLVAPTLPIPTVHHRQLDNTQVIVLITLFSILILVGGIGLIRLVQITYRDDYPHPSEFSSAKPRFPPLPQTPKLPAKAKDFVFPDDKIEKDITFAYPFRTPELTPPTPPRRVPAFQAEEEADIAAMLSLRAGMESACRRGHRDKMESESSQSTATTQFGSLCSESVLQTSVTSMYSMSSVSLWEEEEEEEEDVVIYEVKRAQTQSIEVKKGVLMSWRTSTPSSPIPELPTVVISESISLSGSLDSDKISVKDNGLLHAQLPSLLVTHPSNTSLLSTTSSVSIDLDEFPLPPALASIPSPFLPTLLAVPDLKASTTASKKDKRSTVDQVITLYEN